MLYAICVMYEIVCLQIDMTPTLTNRKLISRMVSSSLRSTTTNFPVLLVKLSTLYRISKITSNRNLELQVKIFMLFIVMINYTLRIRWCEYPLSAERYTGFFYYALVICHGKLLMHIPVLFIYLTWVIHFVLLTSVTDLFLKVNPVHDLRLTAYIAPINNSWVC